MKPQNFLTFHNIENTFLKNQTKTPQNQIKTHKLIKTKMDH